LAARRSFGKHNASRGHNRLVGDSVIRGGERWIKKDGRSGMKQEFGGGGGDEPSGDSGLVKGLRLDGMDRKEIELEGNVEVLLGACFRSEKYNYE